MTSDDLVLDPGVYSLDADNGPEAGLVITGGNFDASSGVMLHIVGDGVVKLTGAGLIQITAITEPGHLYEGVSIFQSRTNFADATIHGTTSMYLTGGAYYFPENHLDLGGTGIAVGNQLITHNLYIHGNGAFTINYDGSTPPRLRGLPRRVTKLGTVVGHRARIGSLLLFDQGLRTRESGQLAERCWLKASSSQQSRVLR
ncbi:MAG: hypothetical protein O7D91_13850 [Planctomycetota bacterium]|nr:hypothetical protein [Planctomycetota bacterium]